MRKLYSFFIVLFMALVFASCKEGEDDNNTSKPKTIEIGGVVAVMETG